MKLNEQGVLPTSDVYFHTPSVTAKHLFFYVLCTGRYQCNATYRVERQSYDSFLLLYIVRGSGYLLSQGRRQPVEEGTLLLVDCYRPHAYGTDTDWDILWCHFDGALARNYYEQIQQNHDSILLPQDPYPVMRSLEKIFRMFHHDRCVNEAMISKHLVTILTVMLTETNEGERNTAVLDEVLNYISQNYNTPLTLQNMADHAMLSPYYFSRVFKRETGYAPHEYVVHVRVNAARYYLRCTDKQSREIAWNCGFSSESNFCKTFKRLTGIPPREYRQTKPELPNRRKKEDIEA